jgi:16S rRNA (adenine1518-N6/adenine1519-N6)-dimethyltransferase
MKNRKKQPFQKKSLSQVFLKDPWPCVQLAEMLKEQNITHVLEIGPGGGALTKELLRHGINVFAVEKDTRFKELLECELQSSETDFGAKFEVVNQSILDFEMDDFLKNNPEYNCICGNIPYNISTDIVFYLLPYLSQIKATYLLVQLEFAQRLASPTGKKSYGSLSVYTQLRSKVALEYIVKKEFFKPIPKVDSAMVSLKAKEKLHTPELLKKVEKISKAAFSQRRKKLSNSLKPILGQTELEDIPVDLSKRCDVLSPEDFVELTKALYPDLK